MGKRVGLYLGGNLQFASNLNSQWRRFAIVPGIFPTRKADVAKQVCFGILGTVVVAWFLPFPGAHVCCLGFDVKANRDSLRQSNAPNRRVSVRQREQQEQHQAQHVERQAGHVSEPTTPAPLTWVRNRVQLGPDRR